MLELTLAAGLTLHDLQDPPKVAAALRGLHAQHPVVGPILRRTRIRRDLGLKPRECHARRQTSGCYCAREALDVLADADLADPKRAKKRVAELAAEGHLRVPRRARLPKLGAPLGSSVSKPEAAATESAAPPAETPPPPVQRLLPRGGPNPEQEARAALAERLQRRDEPDSHPERCWTSSKRSRWWFLDHPF